jgi:hypothetical protein
MQKFKRWFLLGVVAAIPLVTTSCRIPLPNGCEYLILEPVYSFWGDNGLNQTATLQTGEVCP